jgi:hypothetical protein
MADPEMDLEGELARLAGLATDPATPGAARGHLLERVALLQQQLRARRRGQAA